MTVPAEAPAGAVAVFGDRLPLAQRYARMLATDGVTRGLVGPREADRLWERHLLNSATLAELVPAGASVIDVGSGAGLPGIPLALARPDLVVTLLESMARRTAFLDEVVATLGLADRVTVVRGRAEEVTDRLPVATVVVARALAPLDRLARWCLPLTAIGGRVLAVKGASASEEIANHRALVRRLGGGAPQILTCGAGVVEPPTTVIEIIRAR